MAIMEWGLRIVEFLDPYSFAAVSKDTGEVFKFQVSIQDLNSSFSVKLYDTDADMIIIVINGKKGDNAVLLKSEDCKEEIGGDVSYSYIAEKLKKKWHVRFT
jgi:hypothetical protein